MTPDDRLAGFVALGGMVAFATIATYVAWLIREIHVHRPIVTKDPHSGKLFIPRSNLHVGSRTRRHRRGVK